MWERGPKTHSKAWDVHGGLHLSPQNTTEPNRKVSSVDSQLHNTCLFALQGDIDLAMIFANLAVPFWGILADRRWLRRRSILAFGCIGVGSAMTVMSLVSSMLPLVFLRAMRGFLLASLKPVSIIRPKGGFSEIS